MTRMTLKAVHVDGDPRRVPLSERIVDENLGSYHHVPQPHEQLRSAPAYRGSPSRDQPSLLRIIATIMLSMLKRLIRPRSARDVAPTAATQNSRPWRGNRRGLTQVGVPAAGSLAARLNGRLSRLAGAIRVAVAPRGASFGAGG